ncbi:carbohydrate-binding protein [Vagococcus intermedius]|uniref:carbohydrate-binding protein n=1 Tax=Vagococcus intermedius TaxID=2991418 RepID=UPI0023B88031|nr:carbohydrate-binding protein [Vagococcus intermedius]
MKRSTLFLSAVLFSTVLLSEGGQAAEVGGDVSEATSAMTVKKPDKSIVIPNTKTDRITNLTTQGKELHAGDVIEFESSFKVDYNLPGINTQNFSHAAHEFMWGTQGIGKMKYVPGSLEMRTEGGMQIGSDWKKYKSVSDDHVTTEDQGIKLFDLGSVGGSQTRHYRFRVELLEGVKNLAVTATDIIKRDEIKYPDFNEDSTTVTENLTISDYKSVISPDKSGEQLKNLTSPGQPIEKGDIFEYESSFAFRKLEGSKETTNGFIHSQHELNWGEKGSGVVEYVPNTFETRITGGMMVGDEWKQYRAVDDSHITLNDDSLLVKDVNNKYHPSLIQSSQNRHYRFQMKALKPIDKLTLTATDTVERDASKYIGHLKDSVSIETDLKINKSKRDIQPEWQSDKVYNEGDLVSYKGHTYKAKWWTKGDKPNASDAWEQIEVEGEQPAEWSGLKAYQLGDKVTYKGHIYEANYWSKGSTPDGNPAWKLIK